eukprot:4023137-Prymnesium_polylepis.1
MIACQEERGVGANGVRGRTGGQRRTRGAGRGGQVALTLACTRCRGVRSTDGSRPGRGDRSAEFGGVFSECRRTYARRPRVPWRGGRPSAPR